MENTAASVFARERKYMHIYRASGETLYFGDPLLCDFRDQPRSNKSREKNKKDAYEAFFQKRHDAKQTSPHKSKSNNRINSKTAFVNSFSEKIAENYPIDPKAPVPQSATPLRARSLSNDTYVANFGALPSPTQVEHDDVADLRKVIEFDLSYRQLLTRYTFANEVLNSPLDSEEQQQRVAEELEENDDVEFDIREQNIGEEHISARMEANPCNGILHSESINRDTQAKLRTQEDTKGVSENRAQSGFSPMNCVASSDNIARGSTQNSVRLSAATICQIAKHFLDKGEHDNVPVKCLMLKYLNGHEFLEDDEDVEFGKNLAYSPKGSSRCPSPEPSHDSTHYFVVPDEMQNVVQGDESRGWSSIDTCNRCRGSNSDHRDSSEHKVALPPEDLRKKMHAQPLSTTIEDSRVVELQIVSRTITGHDFCNMLRDLLDSQHEISHTALFDNEFDFRQNRMDFSEEDWSIALYQLEDSELVWDQHVEVQGMTLRCVPEVSENSPTNRMLGDPHLHLEVKVETEAVEQDEPDIGERPTTTNCVKEGCFLTSDRAEGSNKLQIERHQVDRIIRRNLIFSRFHDTLDELEKVWFAASIADLFIGIHVHEMDC